MTNATIAEAAVTVPQQAGMLLGHVAGYMSHRTIEIGLKSGLIAEIASAPGIAPDDLGDALGMDDFYVSVWCRAALAAGVLERHDGGYRLAPHLDTILLDESSPAYAGGLFPLALQPEMFTRFGDSLRSGDRLWWDETSPAWIDGVSRTGRPFYSRLVPGGLGQVPGLVERLEAGVRIVDTACGGGAGLERLAAVFPNSELVGVDGDAHSIEVAKKALAASGTTAELIVSPLETMELSKPATLVINNISMHECRDIDAVTERVLDALEPGGWFVISDFPFPDDDEGLRTVPGRIMCGIQFFEAQIDDQLLPRASYDELLHRHGFIELGTATLTPMHALTWGRKPMS
jgi:SAM-dependent methyltransferase